MKKILVLSDTHQNFYAVDFLYPIMKESDYVIHLGDNEKDLAKYKKELGDKLVTVKGNCDGLTGSEKILDVEGIKFLIVHGDKYNVRENLVDIKNSAVEKNCQVALYGHTHKAAINNFEDACLICPGTLAANAVKKSYVYIVVSQGEVLPKIVEINV